MELPADKIIHVTDLPFINLKLFAGIYSLYHFYCYFDWK